MKKKIRFPFAKSLLLFLAFFLMLIPFIQQVSAGEIYLYLTDYKTGTAPDGSGTVGDSIVWVVDIVIPTNIPNCNYFRATVDPNARGINPFGGGGTAYLPITPCATGGSYYSPRTKEPGTFKYHVYIYQDQYGENKVYQLDPYISLSSPGVVGGVVVPGDKFGLLAPYIGLASTITVATAATAVYVKRVKRRKEKQ